MGSATTIAAWAAEGYARAGAESDVFLVPQAQTLVQALPWAHAPDECITFSDHRMGLVDVTMIAAGENSRHGMGNGRAAEKLQRIVLPPYTDRSWVDNGALAFMASIPDAALLLDNADGDATEDEMSAALTAKVQALSKVLSVNKHELQDPLMAALRPYLHKSKSSPRQGQPCS